MSVVSVDNYVNTYSSGLFVFNTAHSTIFVNVLIAIPVASLLSTPFFTPGILQIARIA